MPGKHKNATISFRPSQWEREMIEKRASLSGMHKKDFISKSCIYSRIVLVGNKENIRKIIEEVQDMQNVMSDIARQIMSGDFTLSDNTFQEMKEEYLALAVTLVDIINGADYLFGKVAPESDKDWKEDLKLQQYKKVLEIDEQNLMENHD